MHMVSIVSLFPADLDPPGPPETPNESLIEIVYVSRPGKGLSNQTIVEILEVAQARNDECGITGLLLYDGEHFLQVLEGPAVAVWEVYADILADPRHYGVVTVHEGPIARRMFGRWGMAYRRIDIDTDILRAARRQLADGRARPPGGIPDILHVGAVLRETLAPDLGHAWTARDEGESQLA